MINNDNIICYYLVAHVDILGQKAELLPINNLDNESQIEVLRRNVEFVDSLRDWFDIFFKSSKIIPESVPENYKNELESKLEYRTFSDCIQITVPLQTKIFHLRAIWDVYSALMGCGGMFLLSLSQRKALRVGIDVGIATKLKCGDVYGPVLCQAYELESKFAKYPRIVIGERLFTYLKILKKGIKQNDDRSDTDIKVCKNTAEKCLSTIEKDTDGLQILNYLSNEFKEMYVHGNGINNYREIFEKAFDFVESECRRFEGAIENKLAQKYNLLYNYLEERKL